MDSNEATSSRYPGLYARAQRRTKGNARPEAETAMACQRHSGAAPTGIDLMPSSATEERLAGRLETAAVVAKLPSRRSNEALVSGPELMPHRTRCGSGAETD